MKRDTFYRCKKCGNIVVKYVDGGGALSCCGEEMEILQPNTTDAAGEKHVPDVRREGDKLIVNVGTVDHPMEDDHFIQWVYVITKQGVLSQCLEPGAAPHAEFCVCNQEPVAVYEYCNKHGLWKVDL